MGGPSARLRLVQVPLMLSLTKLFFPDRQRSLVERFGIGIVTVADAYPEGEAAATIAPAFGWPPRPMGSGAKCSRTFARWARGLMRTRLRCAFAHQPRVRPDTCPQASVPPKWVRSTAAQGCVRGAAPVRWPLPSINPFTAWLGTHQSDRRLRLAQEPRGQNKEIQAVTAIFRGLACFIFRFVM